MIQRIKDLLNCALQRHEWIDLSNTPGLAYEGQFVLSFHYCNANKPSIPTIVSVNICKKCGSIKVNNASRLAAVVAKKEQPLESHSHFQQEDTDIPPVLTLCPGNSYVH